MNPWTSPFPDCSICKRMADDGGWLDNKNYRFWVCIECDDWLDENEREVKNLTNKQAIGYMLLACKNAGMTKEQALKLYSEMYYLFDIKTEEEAEKQGFDWYYKEN